jgi:hypothetical protein
MGKMKELVRKTDRFGMAATELGQLQAGLNHLQEQPQTPESAIKAQRVEIDKRFDEMHELKAEIIALAHELKTGE